MATATENGCVESATYNPKMDTRGKRRAGMFQVFNSLKNPFPAEVKDSGELKKFFKKYNLVPFAGSYKETGHALLGFYHMLYDLSPTHSSCINKKSAFAFGSRPTATAAIDPNFDTGEETQDLPAQTKAMYRDALYQYVSFDRPIRQFHRQLATNFQADGNGWIKMKVSTVNGETRAVLELHSQENVLYVNNDPGQPRHVAISPIWTESYLNENPPDIVAMYPNFTRQAGGVMATMFHLKAGDGNWYGRPESQGSVFAQYSEVQNTFYRIRSSYGEFTGKIIIEAEADDPKLEADASDTDAREVGFANDQHRFEYNFTNKSDDPQAVYVTYRPYGARPMFVFSVPPNTKEKYFQVIKGLDEMDILRSHGCTLRFMAYDVSGGFSNDVFLDDYMLYVQPVIEDLRMTVLGFVNQPLTALWQIIGRNELNQYSLSFTSPVTDDIEQYRERRNRIQLPVNDPTQPSNQNQNQQRP